MKETNPFRPSGSPLADMVTQAVDAEIAAQVAAPIIKAEQERLAKEEEQRKIEEVERKLKEIAEALGVMELLEDVRDNVWKGGIIKQHIYVNTYPDGKTHGEITCTLDFAYDAIHTRESVREQDKEKKLRERDNMVREFYIDKASEKMVIGIISRNEGDGIFVQDTGGIRGDKIFYGKKDERIKFVDSILGEIEKVAAQLNGAVVETLKDRALKDTLPIERVAQKARVGFGLVGRKEYFYSKPYVPSSYHTEHPF